MIKMNVCMYVCMYVCLYAYTSIEKYYLTDLYEIWNIDFRRNGECNELFAFYIRPQLWGPMGTPKTQRTSF